VDEARDVQAEKQRGPGCGVKPALADPEVAALIEDRTIFASVASDVLKAHGINLSPFTINRHRQGRCLCR
jgi:hypothetical protein